MQGLGAIAGALLAGAWAASCAWEGAELTLGPLLSLAMGPAILESITAITVAVIEARSAERVAKLGGSTEPEDF